MYVCQKLWQLAGSGQRYGINYQAYFFVPPCIFSLLIALQCLWRNVFTILSTVGLSINRRLHARYDRWQGALYQTVRTHANKQCNLQQRRLPASRSRNPHNVTITASNAALNPHSRPDHAAENSTRKAIPFNTKSVTYSKRDYRDFLPRDALCA